MDLLGCFRVYGGLFYVIGCCVVCHNVWSSSMGGGGGVFQGPFFYPRVLECFLGYCGMPWSVELFEGALCFLWCFLFHGVLR